MVDILGPGSLARVPQLVDAIVPTQCDLKRKELLPRAIDTVLSQEALAAR